MKHLAVFSDGKIQELLSGQLKYDLRFFKKRPEFINDLNIGDTVFFKKEKGDITGQFEIRKIIIIENPNIEDWGWIRRFETDLTQEKYLERVLTFKFLLLLKIDKLEQLITSPVEINKRSKKEWTVLEN